MSNIFTKSNTGFEDESIIKNMNEELANKLNIPMKEYSNSTQTNKLLNMAQQEYDMYEILLKYKDDFYKSINVSSPDTEIVNSLREDPFIKEMYNSLLKKLIPPMKSGEKLLHKSEVDTTKIKNLRIYFEKEHANATALHEELSKIFDYHTAINSNMTSLEFTRQ
jgi:hypothetical protein